MFAKRTNWNLEPNRLSIALADRHAAGKPILDLTMSNPTECGFHYKGQAILDALRNPVALKYEPNPRGLTVARSAVAQYYADRSVAVSTDDIFLTTSTSEAYSWAFRLLCEAGDEVLIPAPSYPLFDFLADIQDVRLVRYPLLYDHGWQIDFHSLEKAVSPRTRAVIVVNPNNPTGNYCKSNEIRVLNELCAPRDLAIIADEVFLDSDVEERHAWSFAVNSGALTFTLSGISKICGLPQMKAAWIVVSGPEPLKGRAVAKLEVVADTYLSPSAPIQCALPSFLDQRHDFQEQLLTRVRENLAELDRQLAPQRACERLKIEGGWNAVIRRPAIHSDEEFAEKLIREKGVCLHPGHFYDFPANGFVIVSLIPPSKQFGEGIKQFLSALND